MKTVTIDNREYMEIDSSQGAKLRFPMDIYKTKPQDFSTGNFKIIKSHKDGDVLVIDEAVLIEV